METLVKNAFVSVDNTETFENKALDELYVQDGEQVALQSKQLADLCRAYGMLTVNVLEKHPIGHISLAANYKDKQPFDTITYEEVQSWTEEENGIGERAEFSLSALKKFLSEVQEQVLRPDHSIKDTQGVKLMAPLTDEDFDLTCIKGTDPAKEAYSGFDGTTLDHELNEREINHLIIGGLATDYCIGNTALDARKYGYEVTLVTDAIRGVAEETTKEMLNLLQVNGVSYITTEELKTILQKKFKI